MVKMFFRLNYFTVSRLYKSTNQQHSIIGYLGFLLGTVSAIFIFPFDMVFYGKLRFVLSATLMLVPFVVFGLSYSNVYFFAKAKEEGKHQNLFSLSLVGVGINFLIFLLGFFAFFYIFSSFQEDSELWDILISKESLFRIFLKIFSQN